MRQQGLPVALDNDAPGARSVRSCGAQRGVNWESAQLILREDAVLPSYNDSHPDGASPFHNRAYAIRTHFNRANANRKSSRDHRSPIPRPFTLTSRTTRSIEKPQRGRQTAPLIGPRQCECRVRRQVWLDATTASVKFSGHSSVSGPQTRLSSSSDFPLSHHVGLPDESASTKSGCGRRRHSILPGSTVVPVPDASVVCGRARRESSIPGWGSSCLCPSTQDVGGVRCESQTGLLLCPRRTGST